MKYIKLENNLYLYGGLYNFTYTKYSVIFCGGLCLMYYQEWLIPNHLVFVRFGGDITVEQIAIAYKRSAELVQESSRIVHLLHDWEQVETFPTQLRELVSSTRSYRTRRENLGWVVAYGNENHLMKFLGNLFFQMARIKFRMFLERAEAIKFLERIDADLPPLTERIDEVVMAQSGEKEQST